MSTRRATNDDILTAILALTQVVAGALAQPVAEPVSQPVSVSPAVSPAVSRLLPGAWESVTKRNGETHRRRIPSADLKVGAQRTGVATDKASAKAHLYEVAEAKSGTRYWKFVG